MRENLGKTSPNQPFHGFIAHANSQLIPLVHFLSLSSDRGCSKFVLILLSSSQESEVMAKRKNPSPRKPGSGKPQSKPGSRPKSDRGRAPQKSGSGYPKSKSSAPATAERDLDADMDAREALLEGSMEQVLSVYDEALDDGMHLPVIFLVDCEDQIGGKLARDWVGREEVDEAITANRAAGNAELTTTFAQSLSFADCQEYVPRMFPYLQGTFDQPPGEDRMITLVVAEGGAATFFVPL